MDWLPVSIKWTLGAMMFYGGIAGAALTLVATIVVSIVMKNSRKNIIRKLNDEYGGNLK